MATYDTPEKRVPNYTRKHRTIRFFKDFKGFSIILENTQSRMQLYTFIDSCDACFVNFDTSQKILALRAAIFLAYCDLDISETQIMTM